MKIRIPIFEKPMDKWTDFETVLAVLMLIVAIFTFVAILLTSMIYLSGWMIFVYIGLFIGWLFYSKNIVVERNDDKTTT